MTMGVNAVVEALLQRYRTALSALTEYIRERNMEQISAGNVCNNLPQAILGAGVGCYQDSVHMKAISDGLRRELEAIAAAKGIAISKAAASLQPWKCRSSISQIFHTAGSGCGTPYGDCEISFSGALVRMGLGRRFYAVYEYIPTI
ncbi:MAG: hypothetical protein ACLU6Y_00920 [Ruminococcus sp.]